MDISVKVNGTERKNYIEWESFRKEDVLTSQIDSLSFTVKKWGNKTWKPSVGDEIIVWDGDTKIFGGYVISVKEKIKRAEVLEYDVECKDYTYEMDRSLVVKSYENKTVAEIITDIKNNYMPTGFTVNNVKCDLIVDYIAFNYEQPSKCLQQLADLVNYNWYVDYDKDIHFFSKFGEIAPFGLTDTNEKYIFDSLEIEEDLSQLKNYVFVRGGEYKAAQRSEKYVADGQQSQFPLAYKYAEKPGVDVNGVQKNVGVDGLDTFSQGYDFLWNYDAKYIVASGVLPANQVVTISGMPLFPILSRARDIVSIAKYGESRYKIIDKTISTREAARDRAKAELMAYSQPLKTGSFQTYQSGLRSGQLINVQSDIRGLNENFLIQKVNLRMLGANKGIWNVDIVSVKTLGIIDFLQNLLLAENKKITTDKNEILEVLESIDENVLITELIQKHSSISIQEGVSISELIRKNPWTIEWVLGPYFPSSDDDNKREGLLDVSFYLY